MRKMNRERQKLCQLCNTEFTALTNKMRFCSPTCRRNDPTNKEKEKLRSNEYKRRNPLVAKAIKLKRFYKMEVDTYYSMVAAQNHVCKICNNVCKTGRELSVDHCHKTGKVRGLLCANCNTGLGAFKDNVESLNAAIKYLKEQEGEN